MARDRVFRIALWASVALNLLGVAVFKLGFFLLFVAYWAAGDVPSGAVLQATPDLILAAVFLWWASPERASGPAMGTAVVG